MNAQSVEIAGSFLEAAKLIRVTGFQFIKSAFYGWIQGSGVYLHLVGLVSDDKNSVGLFLPFVPVLPRHGLRYTLKEFQACLY